jgi:bifunctional UDP-N-acetylglucosamine pyrophosphorylase/glucosamine-1-phosphate N-acetyltransferase
VIRKAGRFIKVTEHKDASSKERLIKECNGGVYVFDSAFLRMHLIEKNSVKNKNQSKEFYLPDLFEIAVKQKKKIFACLFKDQWVVAGVNTLVELAAAQKELFKRIAMDWMLKGVRIEDAESVFIDRDVKLETGCSIGRQTAIEGRCVVGTGAVIEDFCRIKNSVIGKNTLVKNSCYIENSEMGENCSVGPMAHFRTDSKIKNKVKVGNFVELKETTLGDGTAVSHLSYLGDAAVGSNVNVGCGFVTCNYDGTLRDGKRKHASIIEDDVFIGSDCQVVAPIQIAKGSFIASGSTVTETVKEKDSLVIARTKQVVKPGYAKKYKQK